MNRLVSLLLIPMFMLGHVLPHSHAGTGVVETDGHSSRSHIHVSVDHRHHHDGHDHHHPGERSQSDHSQTAAANTLSIPADHDSDAVYLADIDWTVSRAVAAPRIDLATCAWTSLAPSVHGDDRITCRFGDPPDRYAGLPVYLLTASLRL